MECVCCSSIAYYLCIDMSTARFSMFKLLKNNYTCTLS